MIVEILLGANVLAVVTAIVLDTRRERVEDEQHRELTGKVEATLREAIETSMLAKDEIKGLRQNLDMALSRSYIAVAPEKSAQNRLTIVKKDGTGWQRIGERDLDHPDIWRALDDPTLALVDVTGERINNREEFVKWDAEDW